jgi:2-polyprenyl-6-methoxyphenol hydroxylase-like FAD-dependent oxidoreductase
MRIAIVGAGLAGLATAAAFNRAGHDVSVFEQADCLRADGLAINLWSNATSLLPSLGVPASRIPGEPFSRMVWRAAGREVTTMKLPAHGLPHVNVERGDLLNALATALPTLGQGACQSIEDAAVLAAAVAAEDTLDQALRRYASARVPRVRRIIALTRAGAMGRRSNAASRALPPATAARLTALSGGPLLRRITRPVVTVPSQAR